MKIISWRDAYLAGHTHYFTGRPCRNGHIACRAVSGGECMDCRRVRYGKLPERYDWTQSRIQASRAGAETYRTCGSCPHGHDAMRLTATGRCYYCERIGR